MGKGMRTSGQQQAAADSPAGPSRPAPSPQAPGPALEPPQGGRGGSNSRKRARPQRAATPDAVSPATAAPRGAKRRAEGPPGGNPSSAPPQRARRPRLGDPGAVTPAPAEDGTPGSSAMLLGSERDAGAANPTKTKLKLRMGAPAVGASGWDLQAGAAELAGGGAVGGIGEEERGRPKRLTVRLGGAGGVLAAAQRRRLEQDEVRTQA